MPALPAVLENGGLVPFSSGAVGLPEPMTYVPKTAGHRFALPVTTCKSSTNLENPPFAFRPKILDSPTSARRRRAHFRDLGSLLRIEIAETSSGSVYSVRIYETATDGIRTHVLRLTKSASRLFFYLLSQEIRSFSGVVASVMPVDCQWPAAARIAPHTLGVHFGAHLARTGRASTDRRLPRPSIIRVGRSCWLGPATSGRRWDLGYICHDLSPTRYMMRSSQSI